MKRGIIALWMMIFIFFGLVGAELSVSEPNDVYNLGDKLYITATNLKGYESGNLNIDLICSNATINLLKISARAFSFDGGQSYSIPYKILTREDLEIVDLNSIVGTCRMKTNLALEVVESKSFVISNDLNINANINKLKFSPGDEAIIDIDVKRADGEPFDGFYSISNFTVIEGEIKEGMAVKNIQIPNDMEAGEYFMKIEAYDLDSERGKMNNGSVDLYVVINQVPTSIESGISDVEVVPGNNLKINPSILDQSGRIINGSIYVYVTDPDENKYDYNVLSGETLAISTFTNSTQGKWKFYSVASGLSQEGEFEVLGVERIDYTFENGILIVQNVGNIDYYGLVEVSIGDFVNEIDLKLKMGEEKKFILEAPEGEYDINIDDGENSFQGSGFLTGNAIGVTEMGKGGGGRILNFSFMWLFLIFLAGSLGFVMIGMYRKTKVVSSKTSFKSKVKGMGGRLTNWKKFKKPDKEGEKGIIDLTAQKLIGAESVLSMSGEKVSTTIVAVKIKDKDSFSEAIQRDVVNIIKNNCGNKGVVDVKEDFIYLIYSPLITRSYKNSLLAMQVALNIEKNLVDYRKKLSGDLKFGISVNNGDLVSKKNGVKLRYASIGTLFTLSNKLAETAENNVLIPEIIRKSLMRNLKVVKVDDIGKIKAYSVSEIKNIEANNDKLKDLLKRMNK